MSHNYFKGIFSAFPYFAFNEHMNYIAWNKACFHLLMKKKSSTVLPFSESEIVFEIGIHEGPRFPIQITLIIYK